MITDPVIDGNISINKLVKLISDKIGKVLNSSYFSRQEVDGGVFVSAVNGNEVVAAYYHPFKYHTATAVGGIGGCGTVKSSARKADWAIATSCAGISGRKVYYGFS